MMKRTKGRVGRTRWAFFALVPGLLLLLATSPSAGATDPGSEGGIGGTGISGFGVVQRFGSIFVNGREYFLNNATHYRVDGRPGTAHNLHLGDIVLVQAQTNPAGRVTATSVHVEITLAGRIEQVNARADNFTLLGQVIQVTAETRTDGHGAPRLELAKLHAGDTVSVSALTRGEGHWVATRVSHSQAMGFLMRGPVRAIDRAHGRMTIGAQTLAVASAQLAELAVGERVRVAGRYVRGTPIVLRAQPITAEVGAAGTKVEMSGYVEARPGADVLLANGVRLRYTAHTRLSGGTAASIRPGMAIAVRGVTEPDGSVLVNQMVLGEDPMRVDLPPTWTPQPGVGEGRVPRERPEIERPNIERPEIERPEIEIPEQPDR